MECFHADNCHDALFADKKCQCATYITRIAEACKRAIVMRNLTGAGPFERLTEVRTDCGKYFSVD
jgi:hypothetical protein